MFLLSSSLVGIESVFVDASGGFFVVVDFASYLAIFSFLFL